MTLRQVLRFLAAFVLMLLGAGIGKGIQSARGAWERVRRPALLLLALSVLAGCAPKRVSVAPAHDRDATVTYWYLQARTFVRIERDGGIWRCQTSPNSPWSTGRTLKECVDNAAETNITN